MVQLPLQVSLTVYLPPYIRPSCPQSSVALWGKAGKLLLPSLDYYFGGAPKQDCCVLNFAHLSPVSVVFHPFQTCVQHGLGWEWLDLLKGITLNESNDILFD